MSTIATTTLVLAGFLVVVSLVQPAARWLRLPYAVLLAVVGIAVGGTATFLLYAPFTSLLDGIAAPVANLPFNASIFLVVFLPILLFHAALMIDVREVAEDAAPILLLAIVAVFAAAGAIGAGLSLIAGTPLIVALLLGAIVATTDPAAVVAIMHEVGAPPRLTRLLEGESLLNDAAAIVLFVVLVEMLTGGTEPRIAAGIEHFIVSFLGGMAFGVVGGRVYGAALPLLGGSRMAEMTLTVALPYIVYILSEEIDVSGVVAVATAGLTAGTFARVRLAPDNWRYLEQVWEQMGFWASSLIFITASTLVPRLLRGMHGGDELWLLGIVVVAAFLSRAGVLFGLLPLLSALRLSQKVSNAYKLTITWGGLRGAVTLALALAVTENDRIDPAVKELVAVLATGFVLFTLLVNGLTLRPVIRVLKLDRLSPLDQALRDKVLSLSLVEVREAMLETAREYAIAPAAASAATDRYRDAAEELAAADFDRAIADRDRLTIGCVALANQEHRLIRDHQAQQTVSGAAIERLLRNTNTVLDAAKAEGETGYNRAAAALLKFQRAFRIANFLHRTLHIAGPLQRQISIRFETLLVRRLALNSLKRFADGRLRALIGADVAPRIMEILDARVEETARALDALRLQYPEHAEALERRFVQQSGLRLLLSRYGDLYEEGLIGRELFDDLEREQVAAKLLDRGLPPLDLGLRPEELIRHFELFAALAAPELKALARRFRPRLLLPEEVVIRKGERGGAMYLISSGAVEVVLPGNRVRLGSGEFFGEMALLDARPRQADVVALCYCRVLVLTAAEFRRFLREYPVARAEIDRVAEARRRQNAAPVAPG